MKLYTRSGDDGTTGLFGGHRVGKDDLRVAAYGTVDELNAMIGLAIAACDPSRDATRRCAEMLGEIQSRLFDVGADLATPTDSPHADKVARIGTLPGQEMEGWIDEIDAGNEPLQSFVLPGGTELAARLHLARAICRRAERLVVAVGHEHTVSPGIVVYLNRLSDLLFAMARRVNADAGVADVPWRPRPS